TDNLKALQLAAETSARIGRYNDAINFREQIARAVPGDSTNRLELARVIAAAGRNGDAIDRIIALRSERTTPNTVRAQAAEVIGDITRADNSQASRAAALLEPRAASGDAGAALAQAAIAQASGNAEGARSALSRVSVGPLAAVAQTKLGMISLAAGRDSEAATAFERAVYLDADGVVTDAISFRVPDPKVE